MQERASSDSPPHDDRVEGGEDDGAARSERRAWLQERLALWRTTTFGPASEEPYRRRVTDWVLLVFATAIVAALAAHASSPGAIELDLFRLINGLPSQLSSTFRTLYAAGTLWAAGLAVAAAVVGRRKRLARDLLLAGVVAWGLAHIMGALVAGGSLSQGLRAVTRVRGLAPEFPLARIAVVAAVVSTAAPYLTRPTRRIGYVFCLLVSFSALYLGNGLPDDVLGGFFFGLAVAAGVHLVFGSPGGRPTSAQVRAALGELGVHAHDLRLVERQPHGSTVMVGGDRTGSLIVRVIGRDEADAQFLAKLWRFVFYKDSGPTLYLTRLQEVEHSAYVAMVARSRGIQVPEVVIAGQAGPKAAVVVERSVEGVRLADLPAAAVDDSVLAELWHQVSLLRTARIRHGALDTDHVVVTAAGPVIVGFGAGSALTTADAKHDLVSLLVSTAGIVGAERAVAAFATGLGTDPLPDLLPLLQPAALDRRVRSVIGHRRDLKATLDRLRVVGADAAGVPTPRLEQLYRVSGRNLFLAVGTLLAVFALLGQVSNPGRLWHTISGADWTWVTVALALSLGTNIPYAIALMGTVPQRLRLWPTTELQLSMSFTNLAVPGVGGMASQVRFLQKQGIDLASAVTAGGLVSTTANGVVNLGVFALAVALSPRSFRLGAIPVSGIVSGLLVAVAVTSVAAAVVIGVPRLRQAVMPPLRRATSTVVTVGRSPRHLALIIVGFLGVAIIYAFCLRACLAAFGGTLSFWTLLALAVGTQTLAALVPVPGGGAALSAVGLSGLLTAFGIGPQAAVAAVLVNQLVVTYIPALPGWFATRHLIQRDEL